MKNNSSSLYSKIPKRQQIALISMFFAVCLCGFPREGTGQNEMFYVTQYNVEDGLRQSMVKNIIQDSKGLLWMTTGDGLQCFDGSQFYLWRVPASESFSASDNMFRYMTEVDSNNLLLASPTAITLFDKKKASYRFIHREEGMFPVIFKTKIYGMPLVWMANRNFYVYRQNRLEKIDIHYQDTNHQGNIYQGLKSVCLNDSVILLQTQQAILEILFQKKSSLAITAKISTFLIPGMVQAIERNQKGEVFLIVDNKLVKYIGKGIVQEIKKLPFKTSIALLSASNERFLIADNDNKKLYQLNGNVLQKVRTLKTDVKTGISEEVNPFIVEFFVDNDSILWICTDGNGILSYNPITIVCHKNNIGFTRCIEEHNGKMLIGTFKNGLWETNFDLSNKKIVGKRHVPVISDIFSLYSDNNLLWVLTDSELVVLDNNYNQVFRKKNEYLSGHIHGLENGNILVSQNGYAWLYEKNCCSFKYAYTRFGAISSIAKTKKGIIYGTSSAFLTFEPEIFSRDTIYMNDVEIIENYPVKNILIKNDTVWTATNDGIWNWTFDLDKMTLKKREHFLDNECIYALLEDSYNRIWFSSNTGIGYINPVSGTTHFLGPQHSLQSLEFNSNAAKKSSLGWLYFGGINGVNAIDPAKVQTKFSQFSPSVTLLRIADTLYTKGIPDVQHVELSYNRANFSGQFGTVNYHAGKSQLYSIRLAGHDSDWSPPSRTPDFNYQNLRRGKYEFWVRYSNDIKQWSTPYLLLTVTVHPPVWMRWWFIAISALLLFLATYFLIKKIQERKYRQIIDKLERETALERERLRISRDLHDELGAGLSLIMLNASQSKNTLDDLEKVERNFENIAKNTRELYDSMSNLVWLLKPENHSFESLIIRLREMVGGILEDSGIDYNISLPENKDLLKIRREAGQHILLIVRESVNNTLKHSGATCFTFELILTNGQMHLSLSDNGKGFKTDIARPAGNGLKNLDFRVKSLGGSMFIYSAPGKGTTLTYKFPADNIFE